MVSKGHRTYGTQSEKTPETEETIETYVELRFSSYTRYGMKPCIDSFEPAVTW